MLEFKAMSEKTTKFFTKEESERAWILIDAKDEILGRLSVKIANALRGKNKSTFTPNQDCGDFVVVINAEQVKVSGNKEQEKVYHRHSGIPGGHKVENLASLRKRRPTEALRRAVKGMLPHNRLSDRLITKLKIYAGSEHPHAPQLAAQGV